MDSTKEICAFGVFDLARMYRSGKLSPAEVVTAHLQRCDQLNPVLNAFITLLHDSATKEAKASELLFRAGVDLGPLQGIPVSLKDIIRMRGIKTTAASRVLLQEPPDEIDAVVAQNLRAAGAIIIGKTNLHEFATGDPDPAGPFGLVQNPRRIGFHSGSSSSGAGAAAAAGLGIIAMGTDTGGSVRLPAYLCGVAGLKPTTGRINMEGIIPLSFTLDTVGPLARRVSDIAATMASLKNLGAMESSASIFDRLHSEVQGWRVGIPAGPFFNKTQPAVAESFKNSFKILKQLGCQITDFQPPGIDEMNELGMQILRAEGSAYHERFRQSEHLYGSSFKERILPGRDMKALDYLAARRRQLELQQEWLELADRFDVLVVPTGPAVAPRHGESFIEIDGESFPFRQILSRFTRPFSLIGWPALTIPNGVNHEGLPTGLMITGPPDSERRLLNLGHQLEEALGFIGKLGIEPIEP